MINLVISGCNGHMGRVVEEICRQEPEVQIVAGVDVNTEKRSDYPVYADPMEYTGPADVVIDFSSPKALEGILRFCRARKIGAVLATTGYSDEQKAEIGNAAKEIPVFQSANMSLGINVLMELVRSAARILGGKYDVEIEERHHNRKLDAPSGTALMIADAAASALPYAPDYVYDRHSERRPRDPHEIGITSIRGGTIVGEHTVLFAGRDEMIEIKHTALSREIFANGAVRAALFLAKQQAPGMYNMSNLIQEEVNP